MTDDEPRRFFFDMARGFNQNVEAKEDYPLEPLPPSPQQPTEAGWAMVEEMLRNSLIGDKVAIEVTRSEMRTPNAATFWNISKRNTHPGEPYDHVYIVGPGIEKISQILRTAMLAGKQIQEQRAQEFRDNSTFKRKRKLGL